MGRKVVVTSVFETGIENIWCKIQDIETLREICKPKASFISYGNIPPVWKEGETFYFKMFLFLFFYVMFFIYASACPCELLDCK